MTGAFPDGFRIFPGYFDAAAQKALLDAVLDAVAAAGAPFRRLAMPRTGALMSAEMTNLGLLGWYSDKERGYRYEPVDPVSGRSWGPIPPTLYALWDEVAHYPAPPEACLVNRYRDAARLGQHVDWDEEATDAAVVSVSLGDDAVFRLGGPKRADPTRTMRLRSGDVVVLGGGARACHHGVDRITPGSCGLVPEGGRINLTLRRVTRPG